MSRYKDHPIYGVAVPAPENQFYSRGLVFDRDLNQTIAIGLDALHFLFDRDLACSNTDLQAKKKRIFL